MSTIEMWGSVADAWEQQRQFVKQQTAPCTQRMFELAAIRPGESVLELACGPGELGLAAAELVGADGRVVLSDGAQQMLAVAARAAEGLANVETAVVDLDDITLPDASFDVVLCRHGLMFAADHAATVAQIHRVLRPGGRLVIATWARREDNPWLGLLLDAFGAQFGVEFPPPGAPSPLSLDDPERVEDLLRSAGFGDVSADAVSCPAELPSLEAWWELVPQLAGPLAVAMTGMEPEVIEQIRERALDAAEDRAQPTAGGAVELAGSIIVSGGVKEE